MDYFDKSDLNYDRPVEIADGIYWVGFYDTESGLHCNPYLVVDGDEAVVIDGGSRPDFPTVMMKILQANVTPSSIGALIYQHFDPDLCGSVHNFEDIIGREDLKIISDSGNNVFIRHFAVETELTSLEEVGHSFRFSSGRELQFVMTPYAHAPGNFVTFDSKTGVLFTSDIFGSYAKEWDLYTALPENCYNCDEYSDCPLGRTYCPLPDLLSFHQKVMPSENALSLAIDIIMNIPFKTIAPQHGSIIDKPEDIVAICEKLLNLKDVGIDGIVNGQVSTGDESLASLKKRLLEDEGK